MGMVNSDVMLDKVIKEIKAEESKHSLHKNYISGEDFDRLISKDKYKNCFDEN